MKAQLAPHEAIEVRELISQEMLGIKKINASMNMVDDNELKNFMKDSLAAKKTALKIYNLYYHKQVYYI